MKRFSNMSSKDAQKLAFEDMQQDKLNINVFNVAKALRTFPKERIIPINFCDKEIIKLLS